MVPDTTIFSFFRPVLVGQSTLSCRRAFVNRLEMKYRVLVSVSFKKRSFLVPRQNVLKQPDGFHSQTNEAGDPIEPFNLRNERDMGYFDTNGNFVWKVCGL